jgi:glycosyltransferase involved in cell wall biosynthesis
MSAALRDRLGTIGGVRAIGFVPDIRAAYAEAAACVAPVYEGGGTNIKVLEALAYGRTLALTSFAHRGFVETLPAGRAVLVAESPEELARACIVLLRDPVRRDGLAAAGRDAVHNYYSPRRFFAIVRDMVGRALAPHPPAATAGDAGGRA